MAYQSELVTRRRRELGEIIGDGFKIFFANIKNYGLGFLMFVMPVFIIMATVFIAFTGNLISKIMTNDIMGMSDNMSGMLSGFGVMYVGLFLSYTVLYTLAYAGLKAYRENDDNPFSFDALKENMFKYFIPVTITIFMIVIFMFCLGIIPALLFSILSLVSPFLVVLAVFIIIPIVIYYAIITVFMPYIRVEEELGLAESYRRAKYLIKNNWWNTFGVLFVAGIVAGLVSVLFNIPFYIASFSADFGGVGGGEGLESIPMFAALSYLGGLIGGLFIAIYTQITLGLKYYDLVEQKDSSQLINKIDTLGQSRDTFFENEGDY